MSNPTLQDRLILLGKRLDNLRLEIDPIPSGWEAKMAENVIGAVIAIGQAQDVVKECLRSARQEPLIVLLHGLQDLRLEMNLIRCEMAGPAMADKLLGAVILIERAMDVLKDCLQAEARR